MGIYVCKARTLQHLLSERFADKHDFGSDIIPGAKDEGYTVQVARGGRGQGARDGLEERPTKALVSPSPPPAPPTPSPPSIHTPTQAHLFKGYWEDIGTVRAFYEANLGLTDSPSPKFRCGRGGGSIEGVHARAKVCVWEGAGLHTRRPCSRQTTVRLTAFTTRTRPSTP